SMSSFSSASIRCGGTFSAAATTSTCRPCASRAWRSMSPALSCEVSPGLSGCERDAPNSLARSIIEAATFVGQRLARLREAPLQLRAELAHRLAVAQPALRADAQPQRLGIGRRAVVDAP